MCSESVGCCLRRASSNSNNNNSDDDDFKLYLQPKPDGFRFACRHSSMIQNSTLLLFARFDERRQTNFLISKPYSAR
ncbi:hypothetical protein TSAR_002624 [Trichomalopsis sarcophagae]|uniref:Uncharacterized protein n=1 Tax=Trichomalopsis sarcophagae TaxID=543379 RepID=A0A232EV12_9HYME|nr:hypothetical protein TSAR_002624 [Trichomalopsis sarcophagae]